MNTLEGIIKILQDNEQLIQINNWSNKPNNWVLFRESELMAGLLPKFELLLDINQYNKELQKIINKLHLSKVKFIHDDKLEVFIIDKEDWLELKPFVKY